MKSKKTLIKEIDQKYNVIDRKRPKGKKLRDPVKGQLSFGLFAGDENKNLNHE